MTMLAESIDAYAGLDCDFVHGSSLAMRDSALLSAPASLRGDRAAIAESRLDRQFDVALKRAFDISFALVGLIVMLPVLVLLAVALQIAIPGPLFFVQQRVGRYGRMFPCLKFRTMCVDAEAILAQLLENSPEARAEWDRDHKLRNDPRVTKLGAIMRKLSLDELPQMINILRGEMSVVGPRPIVRDEIVKYDVYFGDYCSVKPGLTGLWQVSGRNDVSYDERVQLDCEYARRASFGFDLWIIAKTVPAVAGARGSY